MINKPTDDLKNFIGEIPAHQELTVLPADEVKSFKLGFTISENIGTHVFPWDDPLDADPNHSYLLKETDIKVGDVLNAWGHQVVVSEKNGKEATAKTSGNWLVPLEFDADERHCWVAMAMINPKSKNELINDWLSNHYGCKLRLIHYDIDMDECFNDGYKVVKDDMYSTIKFPNQEYAEKFDEEMQKSGWSTIKVGPSLSIEAVKKRRFGE